MQRLNLCYNWNIGFYLSTDTRDFFCPVSSTSKPSAKMPQLAAKCWNTPFQLCWQEFDIPGNRSQPVPLTWRWRMNFFLQLRKIGTWRSHSRFSETQKIGRVTPLFFGIIKQIWQIQPSVEAQTSIVRALQLSTLLSTRHLYTSRPLGSSETLSR